MHPKTEEETMRKGLRQKRPGLSQGLPSRLPLGLIAALLPLEGGRNGSLPVGKDERASSTGLVGGELSRGLRGLGG